MTTPTITDACFDPSINDTIVYVAPYRTIDTDGNEVEVDHFYGNGGLITAEGYRVKKDGETYARRQVVLVAVPVNVRQALGR